MSPDEKERPVASGLDEIFAASAKPQEPQDAPAEESAPAPSRKQQNRSSDRNRRRSDRRNRGKRPGDSGNEQRAPQKNDGTSAAEPADDAQMAYEEDIAYESTAPADEYSPDNVPGDGDDGVSELTLTTSAPETVEVVGVRFRDTSKTYYFDPGESTFRQGDNVIVETSRGTEYGSISVANTYVPVSAIVPPLRSVVRSATAEDTQKHAENLAKAKEAFTICLGKIRDHGLEMKLIDSEYTFDQSKLTFYFSADGRVDFRELVKDLAGVFRTRIELRQIGIRDEAKLVGGLGVCGRPFCCSTFLSDFVQVSIKMAKEQNLSLNSAKISGACGRLMCCLRYEHETYAEEIRKTPAVGSRVRTADGVGVVIETAPLRARIKVRIGDEGNQTVREYDRDAVTVIPKTAPAD